MKRYQMLIGGEWLDAEGGATFDPEPFLAALPRPWALIAGRAGRCRPRGRGCVRRFSCAGVAPAQRERARRAAAPLWRHRGARSRPSGRARDPRQRQADRGDAGAAALPAAVVPLFRRAGGQARGSGDPDRQARRVQLHPRGAARRGRGDHAPGTRLLLLAAWKLAPALAAGNTAVWKPSEFSSVSALEFGHLFEEAGFPPGVVNIVTGFGSEIGDALVTHPKVAKVASPAATRRARSSTKRPRARSSR